MNPGRWRRSSRSWVVACLLGTVRSRSGSTSEELVAQPPVAVVVEAGDDIARRAEIDPEDARRRAARSRSRSSLAVTVAKLSALDFSIGFDDFVLMPIVPAELYARLRQLDWKSATFGSRRGHQDRRSRHRHRRLRGPHRRAPHRSDPPGVRAAAIPRPAPRPRVHAPGAAGARVGVPVRGRHAHRGYPCTTRAQQAGRGRRIDRDRAQRRLQAARLG